ncbi:DNA repair family protein [Melanomma pulvis-pyrius CBS 109.77]|uniref:DNA repair family protein n=1 Tax=Melanomma pulvis-pyrius CBS 109.77 TaxID=1314802 RepID=A0A6A6XS11_9PLEO|nr:DNA repair family protein [Melanomma pulvis-pyrius CBS 109.77]
MSKRGPLDSFFQPTQPKKPKYEASVEKTHHASYPFPVPHFPAPFAEQLSSSPAVSAGTAMVNRPEFPHLDIVLHRPYIAASISGGVFAFLRQELFFYRVVYTINRGGIDTVVKTPRFTTVFGVDATSRFASDGALVDAKTGRPVDAARYKCTPRPLPACLHDLRRVVEATTGETFNFCLVNYYADGSDSIAYHSDDERFLGDNPAIASISLGARREFCFKHKPVPPSDAASPSPAAQTQTLVPSQQPKVLKLALGSGDMVLMRGSTQKNWLHAVPKRAGVANAVGQGRINITFRKALVRGGTENYYAYNVGKGQVFRWGEREGKMMPWTGEGSGDGVVCV